MLENIKYLLIPHSRERYGIYPIVLKQVFGQLSRDVQIYIYFTILKLLTTLIFLGVALKCELSESHSTATTVVLHCIFMLYHEFKYKVELENYDKLNLIQYTMEQQGMNLEEILDRQQLNKVMMTVKKLIFSQCPDLNRIKIFELFGLVDYNQVFILMLNSPFRFNILEYFQESCDAELLNILLPIILSMFLEFILLYCLVFVLVIALPLLCCLSIYRKGKHLYSIRRLKKYLDSIPPHKYTGSDDTWMKEDKTCCICMQEYVQHENILQLPCSGQHQFHELCIRNWFNVSTSCPICRQQLG